MEKVFNYDSINFKLNCKNELIYKNLLEIFYPLNLYNLSFNFS